MMTETATAMFTVTPPALTRQKLCSLSDCITGSDTYPSFVMNIQRLDAFAVM
jgi:hypothetical protein